MISRREIGNNRERKDWQVRAKVAQIRNSFEHVKSEVSIIYSKRDDQQAVKHMNPEIPGLVGAENIDLRIIHI